MGRRTRLRPRVVQRVVSPLPEVQQTGVQAWYRMEDLNSNTLPCQSSSQSTSQSALQSTCSAARSLPRSLPRSLLRSLLRNLPRNQQYYSLMCSSMWSACMQLLLGTVHALHELGRALHVLYICCFVRARIFSGITRRLVRLCGARYRHPLATLCAVSPRLCGARYRHPFATLCAVSPRPCGARYRHLLCDTMRCVAARQWLSMPLAHGYAPNRRSMCYTSRDILRLFLPATAPPIRLKIRACKNLLATLRVRL